MDFTGEKKHESLSKIATNDGHGENSPYFDGWKAYDRNPFHPTQNPDGVIQMGLAENQLCFDLIEEWIKNNPAASICTSEGVGNFKDVAIFQDYHGLLKFRQAVAKFMGRVRRSKAAFDPSRVVMSGGATGASETLIFCLADPGDAFLVPSPYYPAFDRDIRWRTGIRIIPVECHMSNNFHVTLEQMESAYTKATEANINVKGVILTNPSNPLGITLSKETLTSLLSFTSENNLHMVCDEIYSATVFNSPAFTSISEVMQETKCNPDLVHIIYSLSKDMGLPGFRVGIIYSYNDQVVNCARKMSSFGLVSSQSQHFLASMLSDDVFIEKFLEESSRRLAKRHSRFVKGLEQERIHCLEGNAGLFLWMDLRHLMKEPTFDGEMKLWRVILEHVELDVSPGSSFHCPEPGFFRVCFANMDDYTMEVALKRIREFVSKGNEDGDDKKLLRKKHWKNRNLRLSFTSRKCDESLMSPHQRMSPHSPVPHSPLVLARP
uniref:1-aminocyclopropane-1-carboxylate synthase n=1 Tax=Psidium guajava TaxID=120290 RepID=A0A0U1VLT4_PSIGU|nr:1-aminocyclopropane-1-carboxylate synthase [Psidium guajava]